MAGNGQNGQKWPKCYFYPQEWYISNYRTNSESDRLVSNNSWVFVSFSIFGQFQVAGNGQKWQNVILMHYTINNDIYWLKLRNIDQRKYQKLIFSFLVNSRWLEMGKMAKNGQNAISMHNNDIFSTIIPILGQDRLVLNNSWVFVSFSIFGLFQEARNGQKWPKMAKCHFYALYYQ